MSNIYLFRRKTAADWTAANPVLMSGELGLETDTTLFKFGNGTTAWNSLAYAGASVGIVPWGSITGTLSSQTDLVAALAAKQATLVSATNIKTINGSSILGAGDLVVSGGGGSAAWGGITGTLSAQTDLQTALNAKAAIAGQVFTGAISATNLSGTNTGDQTITLTGDVTGTGTGSFAATIGAGVVTLSKMANMATSSLIYRKTAGTGAPEVNTLATLKTDLGLTGTNSGDQTITLTGDVTGSGTGSFAATIGAGVVTYAKMQATALGNVVLAKSGAAGTITEVQLGLNNLLGRGSSGNLTTITVDATLAFTGSVLGVASITASLVSDFTSAAKSASMGLLVAAQQNLVRS